MHQSLALGALAIVLTVGFLPAARCFVQPAMHTGLARSTGRGNNILAKSRACCRKAGALAIQAGAGNGEDPAYPYLFDGRLWFRPAIVRVPEQLPAGVTPIGLFGYSIGCVDTGVHFILQILGLKNTGWLC